jgi:tetratricopeptide (TPR) repeat protein
MTRSQIRRTGGKLNLLDGVGVRRSIVLLVVTGLLGSALSWAESAEWSNAYKLYQRTDYRASIEVLLPFDKKDAAVLQLLGQNYFMLGEYVKATQVLERSVSLNPRNTEALMWLGRAFGRRAESSSLFTAPGYASKSRQMFERAVAADPSNREAIGDLFDYYLQAPGFLGGGENKAVSLAAQVERRDPAEGHYYQALLAEKHKQYDTAEEHFRAALHLAPRQVGRFIDLAKYLAERGRAKESDAVFEEAERVAPNTPKLLYERAQIYVHSGRNLEAARRLLERYLHAPLTPSDPPRASAEALLRKIGA